MTTDVPTYGYKFLAAEDAPAYYGMGYCGCCGTPNFVTRPLTWWEPDEGWKTGVLCASCMEEMTPPNPEDYAYDAYYGDKRDDLAPDDGELAMLYDLLGGDADALGSMFGD